MEVAGLQKRAFPMFSLIVCSGGTNHVGELPSRSSMGRSVSAGRRFPLRAPTVNAAI